MSDQMPDEVWLDEMEVWVPHACDGTRYIRADLYEQTEAERDRLRAALGRVSILLNGNTQLRDVFNAGKIAQEALDHD